MDSSPIEWEEKKQVVNVYIVNMFRFYLRFVRKWNMEEKKKDLVVLFLRRFFFIG